MYTLSTSTSIVSLDQRNWAHRIISDWDGSMGIKQDYDSIANQKRNKTRVRFLWRSPRI